MTKGRSHYTLGAENATATIQQTSSGQPTAQTPSLPSQSNFAQTFQDKNTKTKETMCEWGFWISIVGLICIIFGAPIVFGGTAYFIACFLAAQGLKTRKKSKAIAGIVISIIAFLITVILLIIANM